MSVEDGYSEKRGRPKRVLELSPAILLYAFRYALGRSTHAVNEVADLLEANAPAMMQWREQIVQDIDVALVNDMAGMEMDRAVWERVRTRFS